MRSKDNGSKTCLTLFFSLNWLVCSTWTKVPSREKSLERLHRRSRFPHFKCSLANQGDQNDGNRIKDCRLFAEAAGSRGQFLKEDSVFECHYFLL